MSPQFDDTDDDGTLRTRRDDADDYLSQRSTRAAMERGATSPVDREFTLNTGVVLALFFALALLCAVFFGFGYSIGHKSGQAAAVAGDTGAASTSTADPAPVASSVKPSPGSPASTPVPSYVAPGSSEHASSTEVRPASATPRETPAPARAVTAPAATDASTTTSRPAPVVRVPPPPPAPSAAPIASTPATGAGGTTYVQIAAVSHQEDADVLLSALRRRGYAVITRTDAADHLIHVQVGPFAVRKDAEAMRQRLLGDGYNAFLK